MGDGLDFSEQEPPPESELSSMENVTARPHISSGAETYGQRAADAERE